MEMQKKAAIRGRRERSPEQEYLVCELATKGRGGGRLIEASNRRRGMNLDVTVNAPQVLTVAVKAE
jgi:hypothetical protein